MTTIELYHETYGRPGQQTPLLLVHGGAGTIGTNWGHAIPTFAADRLVIGVELQGHGHTRHAARAYTFVNSADDIAVLIRRNLETLGRTNTTELTAFTDGCPGLWSILTNAGVTSLPILDWFHIAMRLQHAKQAADVLSTDEPGRMQAKTVIVAEVERLHWRIWNGKAKDAQVTIERIRKVMHVFKGEHSHRWGNVPSRKLWHALHAVDAYLSSQSTWLVNYAERHRAGLRVGTSITEGTANFLVNRRMAKSQQLRWSRRGADLLLQVRSAVYNGTFGSGFGQRFESMSHPHPTLAKAA